MTTNTSKTPIRAGLVAGLAVMLVSSFCLADFATLDRQTNKNGATLNLGFTIPDDDEGDNFGMRTELYGQFYYKWVGAYIVLPLNYLILDGRDDEFAMANMELGLYNVLELGDMVSIVSRFGVGIPTASNDIEDFIPNMLGGYGRLTDLAVQVVPEATSIRPSVSAVLDTDLIFARVDVGLDVLFPDHEDADDEMFLRLNAGVGVHAGPVDFAVEFVNLGHLDDDDSPTDASEQWQHTLGFRIAYPSEYVQPFFAYIMPLDDDLRGDLHMLSMGVTGKF